MGFLKLKQMAFCCIFLYGPCTTLIVKGHQIERDAAGGTANLGIGLSRHFPASVYLSGPQNVVIDFLSRQTTPFGSIDSTRR